MPLRDHFEAPVVNRRTWEEFHAGWPMVIVQHLRKLLPPGYTSGPRVHLGSQFEVDIGTHESDHFPEGYRDSNGDGGVATVVWAPAKPSVAIATDIPDYDEYEVRIYDAQRERTLVAVIELVSPGNKDRPETRNAFVGKCAALLQKGVAVSIVDLVTARQFNLYAELMAFLGQSDPTLGAEPSATSAASCRWIRRGEQGLLETWSHNLVIGEPLPTLPLWLTEKLVIPLDLEQCYEKTCADLDIP